MLLLFGQVTRDRLADLSIRNEWLFLSLGRRRCRLNYGWRRGRAILPRAHYFQLLRHDLKLLRHDLFD